MLLTAVVRRRLLGRINAFLLLINRGYRYFRSRVTRTHIEIFHFSHSCPSHFLAQNLISAKLRPARMTNTEVKSLTTRWILTQSSRVWAYLLG